VTDPNFSYQTNTPDTNGSLTGFTTANLYVDQPTFGILNPLAVRGAGGEISRVLPNRCPECHGTGAKPGSKPRKCPDCGGTGEKRMAGGMFRGPCPRCQGDWEVRITEDRVTVLPAVEHGG